MATWQEKRAKYEFDRGTKRYAKELAGWKCEQCGCSPTKDNWLEAHHILPILAVVKEFQFISPIIIKHLVNVEILCHDCHIGKVHAEMTESDWGILAQTLIDRYHDWLSEIIQKKSQ